MEWISVKDRLPEKNKEVLAYRFYPEYGISHEIIITHLCWILDDEPIWADEVSNYSHWMPLPPPPNEIKICSFCGTPENEPPKYNCCDSWRS